MGDKPKTAEELAEREVNKQTAKSIAKRLLEIKKLDAQKKKRLREIERIKKGEFVPDDGTISTTDEDDDSSSLKVVFLLDESGSMSSCKPQTISGFNEYLQTLQKEKKKINVTLTKFHDSSVNIVYSNVPVSKTTPLTESNYNPCGSTPLFDAIGKTVNNDKETKKTLFVILTDGQENSSREYQRDAVVNLIKEQESHGWTFVYLGADQNAWSHAQHLGLHMGNTMSYDSMHTSAMYKSLGAQTVGYAHSSDLTSKNFFGGSTSKKKPTIIDTK
jgi:Mg-chelatase subunit ChlD